ncbi:hypothetical protein acsn021_24940 [Anaerocolumna cellulosilytica]|uniref:Uncharacterized protein n=1 Tax=Anaerocolumna cellulosilytica TaxID=433286 RepID=A0A6S6R6K8_9FIRM|nr:hypothetical protein [Anaerocolumna cellulosilytica]MBB5193859.1 hypothetical protein [Anaerocolumna cellulosilytica]BCJ94925.1 hypothetical protein acsn021_24940 [Anaerocolumna cellulosilytica]
MFEDSYRSYLEKIEPNKALVEKTKEMMYKEQRKLFKSSKDFKYRKILATAAILTILATSVSKFQEVRVYIASKQSAYKNDMSAIATEDKQTMTGDKVPINTDQKAENEVDPVFLSEADSYVHEVYGKFLPKAVPEAYQFEEAVIYNENTVEEKFLILYTEDFKEIRISISRSDGTADYVERVVKAEETERYNISDYSVPYADTIPEPLYLSMRHPIFQWNELTPEVLAMRKELRVEKGEARQSNIVYRFAVEEQGYIIDYYIKSDDLSNEDIFSVIKSSEIFK